MTVHGSRRRRRTSSVALASMVALGAALAVTAPAVGAESVTDARPDRVVLTPASDPSTAQSFSWRTGAEVLDGAVHIRLAGSTDDWRVVEAYTNAPISTDGPATVSHSATVTGLVPGTEYEYYVGSDEAVDETWTFRTAGQPGEEFTFLYFGDAQNELDSTWRPAVEAGYSAFPDAIGTVNAGDLINNSNNTEWDQWFAGMDGFSQTSNVIAAPGNHEYSDDSFLRQWKSNFEYPANGPEAGTVEGDSAAAAQERAYREHMAEVIEETVYYTDYQGVRFIALNASRSQATALFTPEYLPPCLIGCADPVALWLDLQAAWLDHVLSTNPNQWAVATFHQPVFSTAVGRDEVDLREAWLPVFQENDIDLVLMGHDHTYARGYVSSDATTTPGITTGPVYAVSVAGPKYYDQQPEDDNVWTRNGATQVVRAGQTSTFQGITVSGGTLRYESYVAAKWDGDEASTTDVPVGGLLDSFTITKRDDGTKWVTEDGVDVPAPGEGPDPVNPVDPADPEEPTDEEPAEEPADVPLGHVALGELRSPSAAVPGPSAYDERNGVLFVADQATDGTGRIEAVDVATDTVLRSFEVGGPVIDLTYSTVEGGMMLVGWEQDGAYLANGFVAGAAGFGAPLLDEPLALPAPFDVAPIRGVGFDAGAQMAYLALDASALGAGSIIVAIDIDNGSLAGQTVVPAGVQRMKVDPATGILYVTFDDGDAGALRLYNGRGGLEVVQEHTLDAGTRSVELDQGNGRVYVGHATADGGVSVVDVLTETVHRESGLAADVEAVSIDRELGLVYLTSTSAEAPVVVAGRHQAPRITSSPSPVTVDAGEPASFSASAWGVPTPAVQWELRTAGSDAWTAVVGATSDTLVVPDATDGAQYRAVFTNDVAGETYSTRSGTATVTVVGGEVPTDPGTDPTDPGTDPTDPGADPTDPGTGPTDPGTDPTDPGTDPAGPGTDPNEGTGSGGGDDDGDDAPGGGSLPSTGAPVEALAGGALALLLAGLMVSVVRRTRANQMS
ncbi:fibronectin type III domain-containing protein [Georgenia wangjunii]|uniref:fibronectin type III domain-containing protein n=1 Tax=Georgenia wangjunii TaxID=3117730 RepID=UPI002F265A16